MGHGLDGNEAERRGTRKRSYRLGGFASDLVRGAVALPHFAEAYVSPRRIDPALRETVMVAISRMNRCRHCSAIHGLWAERAGVDGRTADALARQDHTELLPNDQVAVLASWDLLTARDDGERERARERLRTHFAAHQVRQIEAVAREIRIANRLGNTWDRLTDRLRGRPAADSSLVDELLVLAAVAPFGAPFLAISKAIRLTRGEPDV